MTRPAVLAALVLGLFAAAAGPAFGAAAPPLQHPNPALAEPRVDYANPLIDAEGNALVLAPLRQAVMLQAVQDQAHLAYLQRDDLGGFRPAPVGDFAASSGGRQLVGIATGSTEIPHFADGGGGAIRSFAFVGGPPGAGGTPDNGTGPVQGLGVPPAPPTPTNTNTVPLPNQGFGGVGGVGAPPTTTTTTTATTTATTGPAATPTPGTTTTTTKPPGTTTTRPTTTTPTTTQTTTATTPAPTTTDTSPAAPAGASCGTVGLSITSDHDTCHIYATNMAPGGAASEVMTIRNDSGSPFTLALRVSGTSNRLWDDLTLGVWTVGTAAPTPLPPLAWWTAQENPLGTLQPGESVRLNVVLYLPTSAGNATQNKTAVVDLEWSARGI